MFIHLLRRTALSCMCVLLAVYSGLASVNHGSLSGYALDAQTHQPLQGATVGIPDLSTGAVTDARGHFTIKDIPEGSYLVQVRYLGYRTYAENVHVQGDLQRTFYLQAAAVEQHEVVITGQSRATRIAQSPVPITVISGQYLRQNLSTNAVQAIANIPGVTAVTTGPNVAKPFIRGLGYNRVLTLVDGMPLEGQQWGDEHGVEVDQYNVGRVEVVKGPSSLSYGSDALAGVVNFLPTPFAEQGHTTGGLLAEYQGNNGMIGQSAYLSGNHNGFSYLARVSHKMAKDYRNKYDGRVYATNFRETDAYGSLAWNAEWGSSQLELTHYDDLQAIPDGSRDSASRKFTRQITEADTFRPIVPESVLNSYALPALHQHVQSDRIYWKNRIQTGSGSLQVQLGFERSHRREYSHPQQPSIAGLDLRLNSYLYRISYGWQSMDNWNFNVGYSGMYQTNDVTHGTEFIIPNYSEMDQGVFATASRQWTRWTLESGVRYDLNGFRNQALYSSPDPATGFDHGSLTATGSSDEQLFHLFHQNFNGATGSLGLTYKWNDRIHIKANIARGFRAPNVAEISANGVHPGTNMYQIGNSHFSPEFNWQEDLGADYASEHLRATLAVFHNDIRNYIYDQRLLSYKGGDSVLVPGNQTFQYVAGHAELYGAEMSLDIHPHPLDWLHFENSLSMVYAINKSPGASLMGDSARFLPDIPPVHGVSELRGEFKKINGWLGRGFAKVDLDWFATQNRAFLAYGTETPTPGYALVNIGMGANVLNRKKRELFRLTLFADNLMNTAYQDHLSRLKYFDPYPADPRPYHGIYNMGRNIGIRLNIPLDLVKD